MQGILSLGQLGLRCSRRHSEGTPQCWLSRCDTTRAIVARVTRIQKPGMLILELSECVESGVGRSRRELNWRID